MTKRRKTAPDLGGWNVKRAAAWSGMGEATIRDWAKAGKIPCYRIGRKILIPAEAFKAWFNRAA